ncbi:sulfotransferase [Pseudotabrizicola alkalilacus]|uniref:sulfotransferase n=1 Tax=Pseudotabrizicola alkalilacus TaxID=2305252 RepID=UPI0013140CE6|nr:sulfotransferase [Pseudotabrizicola alkalilacus]
MTSASVSSPLVAIGGLGGSGTRVFAATLQAAGIALGARINTSLDNLWFTVLFKRAAWSCTAPDAREVTQAADLFVRAMTIGLRDTLTPDERALLQQLRAELPPLGAWQCGARVEDADSLLNSGPADFAASSLWGWKEPNTHIFLPQLAARFPRIRYIHVVRDGLDMAFSNNTWQARHWAHLYGLSQDTDTPLPLHQLRYWTAANRAALDYGAAHMGDRFLIISYEEYCRKPERYWQRLHDFVGLRTLCAPPADLLRPTNIGRSQDHDLSLFPAEALAAARAVQTDVLAFHDP